MWMQAIALTAAVAANGVSTATAGAGELKHHHRHHVVQSDSPIAGAASYGGPRLVLHPAHNIACMTPYQATRALPCDQPVWVYGNPCEIDLGLGRSRSCD
jgi:hypothetical protein